MGVSTNAIVFYGYCWEEEDVELLDDWRDVVAAKRGFSDPWSLFIEPSKNLKYEERERIAKEFRLEHKAQLDAYYAAKREIEKEFGCEISSHCSGDCPIPYIEIVGAGKIARRGYPQGITAADLQIETKWDAMLRHFCSELNIVPPSGQSPQWWLVSMWH